MTQGREAVYSAGWLLIPQRTLWIGNYQDTVTRIEAFLWLRIIRVQMEREG